MAAADTPLRVPCLPTQHLTKMPFVDLGLGHGGKLEAVQDDVGSAGCLLPGLERACGVCSDDRRVRQRGGERRRDDDAYDGAAHGDKVKSPVRPGKKSADEW